VCCSHYRRAAGALVVYDVSNRVTFDNAQEVWLRELRAQADPSSSLTSCVMLVGNKVDLDPTFPDSDSNADDGDIDDAAPGFVSRALHERAASQLGVLQQRASAKSGANVCAAFEQLIVAIFDHDMAQRARLAAQNRRTEPLDSFHLDDSAEASRQRGKKKKKSPCCDQ
jgi:GTPase SAR1 family protein